MNKETLYLVKFAGAVCIICSILVSGSAVLLKDRQEENRILDRQKKVLGVAGIIENKRKLSRAEVKDLFEKNIRPRVVNLKTAMYMDDIDPTSFDQKKTAKNPQTSRVAPDNLSKVRRLPHYALVYQVIVENQIDMIIIPIEGMGLWSTLYGYLALGRDANTIQGITYYDHGETPGLGGEVDNEKWKSRWKGRRAFDKEGKPAIHVIKGVAGSAKEDPYRVDGLSGATMTSRGVTNMMDLWLGPDGFGPYLEQFRKTGL